MLSTSIIHLLKLEITRNPMNIGQAAQASGISSKMIRHYENIGLTTPSLRSDTGYRLFSEQDIHILKFIKSARSLGFSLEQIKHLLSLWQNKGRTSAEVKALAQTHINTLSTKIEELTRMRDELHTLAGRCQGDDRPDCPILSGISHNLG